MRYKNHAYVHNIIYNNFETNAIMVRIVFAGTRNALVSRSACDRVRDCIGEIPCSTVEMMCVHFKVLYLIVL